MLGVHNRDVSRLMFTFHHPVTLLVPVSNQAVHPRGQDGGPDNMVTKVDLGIVTVVVPMVVPKTFITFIWTWNKRKLRF